MPCAILYISYDGMLEPLGESQVVSYLERLATTHPITLLSYEKPRDLEDRARLQAMASRLARGGIRWIRLRYHKRPSLAATAYDLVQGVRIGLAVSRREGVRIVHARGYVPSLIALALKRATGANFLFDMRGLWPEEKVDAGQWSRRSLAYRLAKRWERRFFERADAIVSLTQAGVAAFPALGYAIPPTTPIEVIPTCADLARFSPGPKDPQLLTRLRLHGATVAGSIGTLSTWYLRGPTLRYLGRLAQALKQITVLLVTRDDHAALRRDAVAAGIPPNRLVITQATFDAMPACLRLMDLGVFFIKACLSKQASAPTKLAEFLASGVPVVINEGIGDSGTIVRTHQVGLVLPDVREETCAASLGTVWALLADASVPARCREVAERVFDLEFGVQRYHALYERLLIGEPFTVSRNETAAPVPLGVEG